MLKKTRRQPRRKIRLLPVWDRRRQRGGHWEKLKSHQKNRDEARLVKPVADQGVTHLYAVLVASVIRRGSICEGGRVPVDLSAFFRRQGSPLVTSPSEIGRLVRRRREAPPIRLEATTNIKARSVQEVGRVAELPGEGVEGSFTFVGHHVFGLEAEAEALAQSEGARNGLLAQVGEQPRA